VSDASERSIEGDIARPISGPILFFDGECGLCARSVRWVLRHDRARRFRFAPLQGSTFAAIQGRTIAALRGSTIAPLQGGAPSELSSMVVIDERGTHRESGAVRAVCRQLGGVWGALAVCSSIVPRPIGDRMYRFVARRRHRWFGGAETCAIASAEERSRFLP
jgi:predicted DCC family thiol-disulfide oxidoreductase YuxK